MFCVLVYGSYFLYTSTHTSSTLSPAPPQGVLGSSPCASALSADNQHYVTFEMQEFSALFEIAGIIGCYLEYNAPIACKLRLLGMAQERPGGPTRALESSHDVGYYARSWRAWRPPPG